jgi:3-hydroxyacyl-[acyl-carrier-protein] dehydratase
MTSVLLDHFYKIDSLQKEETGVSARVTFDVAHAIFKGHFPDMPIVPGVCQTQMLAEVLSQALGTDMQLRSAASIKFLSIVDPTKHPTLDLIITFTKNDNSYNVSAQYKWEETTFFKFKGIFAAAA